MKKTKVVCTMGPNTNDKELMRKLIRNGMDVARFNFSHGDHAEQKSRMDLLKELREEEHSNVAILLDTKGPEIRTGLLKDGRRSCWRPERNLRLRQKRWQEMRISYLFLIRD